MIKNDCTENMEKVKIIKKPGKVMIMLLAVAAAMALMMLPAGTFAAEHVPASAQQLLSEHTAGADGKDSDAVNVNYLLMWGIIIVMFLGLQPFCIPVVLLMIQMLVCICAGGFF